MTFNHDIDLHRLRALINHLCDFVPGHSRYRLACHTNIGQRTRRIVQGISNPSRTQSNQDASKRYADHKRLT